MGSARKTAEVSPPSAASPLPQIEVNPTKAPGPRGPVGTAPRTNYSRVNTGSPPVPDAGASSQKSVPPLSAGTLPVKTASEGSMNAKMSPRLGLQDMVKAAMDGARNRMSIAQEAHRHVAGEEKTASPQPQDGSVATEYAMKLAEAINYISENFEKAASTSAVGEGPGALTVTESHMTGSMPGPGQQGTATSAHQPPKNPGLQKESPKEHSPTQMQNNYGHAPGGGGTQQAALTAAKGKVAFAVTGQEKKSSAPIAAIIKAALDYEAMARAADAAKKPAAAAAHAMPSVINQTKSVAQAAKPAVANAGMKFKSLLGKMAEAQKHAEDAINPAQISAGSAAPNSGLDATQSVGGMPGNSNLIESNQSVINTTKGQAKSPQKSELKNYVSEPALSGEHDKTLREAFSHTGEAGTKFASANVAVKTAAARALLEKLAAAAEEKTQAA